MGRHGNVICILRPTPQQRKYVHRRSYGHELSLITNSIIVEYQSVDGVNAVTSGVKFEYAMMLHGYRSSL